MFYVFTQFQAVITKNWATNKVDHNKTTKNCTSRIEQWSDVLKKQEVTVAWTHRRAAAEYEDALASNRKLNKFGAATNQTQIIEKLMNENEGYKLHCIAVELEAQVVKGINNRLGPPAKDNPNAINGYGELAYL